MSSLFFKNLVLERLSVSTKQFQIAQQDHTNLAAERYMSSKKTSSSVPINMNYKFLEVRPSEGYDIIS